MTDHLIAPEPGLLIELPALRVSTQARGVVRVVCRGWARLRVQVGDETPTTAWLRGGQHVLLFTAPFGERIFVERLTPLGRQQKRSQLPPADWYLRSGAMDIQPGLADAQALIQLPVMEMVTEATAPSMTRTALAFKAEIPSIHLDVRLGGEITADNDGRTGMVARLSALHPSISPALVTPMLNTQALTSPLPDLRLDQPQAGNKPEHLKTPDLQGAHS